MNRVKAKLDKAAKAELERGILPKGAKLDSNTLIVRRCAPVLSQVDARLLQLCAGPTGWHVPDIWGARARKLAKLNLLDQEGSYFTTTEPGKTVLSRFYTLGWLKRPKGNICTNCAGLGGGITEEDVGWTCTTCSGTGIIKT